MKELNGILKFIQDAGECGIEDVRKRTLLPVEKIEQLLSFLEEQELIERRIRITSRGLKFLELGCEEHKKQIEEFRKNSIVHKLAERILYGRGYERDNMCS